MEGLIAAHRFLHFASVFILFGSIAFRLAIASGGVRPAVAPRLARWELSALWIAAVTAVLWLMLAIAEAGDGLASAADPAMVGMFLTGTHFGRVWILRLGILALLLIFATGRWDVSDRVRLMLSGLLVATLGWIGHPAKFDGLAGLLHCSMYSVHALAAALWTGTLPALALALSMGKSQEAADDIAATVSRFSLAGYLAVSLVVVTGLIGTWLMLGSWPSWTASPYQFWLGTKLALVTLMLAFAATNRFLFTPMLAQHPDTARRGILALVVCEATLGYVILALVAHFGTLPPMGD